MSAKERIKTAWETIITNPDVVGGTVQIATAIFGLLMAALAARSKVTTV